MKNDDEIDDKLNELVQYLQDSKNGYKECTDCVNSPSLKKLFIELAEKRKLMLSELNEGYGFIEAMSQKDGTILGKFHQIFTSLKSLLTNKDPRAIIKEIKRGENLLLDSYKELLQEELDISLETILRKQLAELENDYLNIDKKLIEL